MPPKTIKVCTKTEYGKICKDKPNPEYEKLMKLLKEHEEKKKQ